MCMEQSSKLDNLATVMQLYSHGTFGKDKFQWTKCVVKYLFDVYMELSGQMVAFLVEVLEKVCQVFKLLFFCTYTCYQHRVIK